MAFSDLLHSSTLVNVWTTDITCLLRVSCKPLFEQTVSGLERGLSVVLNTHICLDMSPVWLRLCYISGYHFTLGIHNKED